MSYTMTYSGPQVILATKYGEVEVTFTEAGHAHVSANASSGHGPGDIEYRGRHWYVSVHVYADANEGPWGEGLNNGSYRHQFTESGTFGTKTIAPTYRKAIMTAITEAVSAYVAAHPAILRDAEINHVKHDLARKIGELREAEDKVATLRAEYDKINAEYQRLADEALTS